MIIIASVAVAIVCFIVYTLERRSKEAPIEWVDATKLSLFGGLITAGVVFATSTNVIADTMKNMDIPAVQDMFVGKPTW